MKYSDEKWAIMIAKANESGLSGRKWCEENGIAYGAFRYHKYKKNDVKSDETSNETIGLVKVLVSDDNMRDYDSKGFEIKIGKASINVNAMNDLEAIARLVNLINEA